jgi:hypothetical protein
MSTSDRTVALEALAGIAIVIVGVSIASPDDIWMTGFGLHPAWIPVILLAARYGPRGLFWSLGVSVAALALVDLIDGGNLAGLDDRTHSASDLLALVSATLVAWIGMMHDSRMSRAQSRLDRSLEEQAKAQATEQALHDNLCYLRGRLDRLELSLSVWRDLAGRLEKADIADAADAALELCSIRLGAQAGRVQVRDGDNLTAVAGRGTWVMPAVRFRDKGLDATVQAALFSRQVTLAGPDATDTDSAVAAPIIDEGSGVVLGMLALRALPEGGLRAADLHDLQIIAQWLAPALTRPQKEPPPGYLVTDKQRVTARYKQAKRERGLS